MLPSRLAAALVLLCAAGAPSFAAKLPSCFPPTEIARARIVRVERNGVLVLEDGRAARLEGILLPAGAGDHAPEFLAAQAVAKLAELATGHIVTLAAEPPKEDRYGRLRAEAFVTDGAEEPWLQRALLRDGLARVSVAPDRDECVEELYAAESHARAAKAGIWSLGAYRVRTPEELGGDVGTFQIVEGTVRAVTSGGGRVYLEFGSDRSEDFAVVISSDDLKNFHAIGVDPFGYQGQTLRVRGWIDHLRRLEMEIATPAAVEVVASPPLRGAILAPQ